MKSLKERKRMDQGNDQKDWRMEERKRKKRKKRR